jgi:hypothetical protein
VNPKKFENTVIIGVFGLNNRLETPKEKRERLRQQGLIKNPGGALRDGFSRCFI